MGNTTTSKDYFLEDLRTAKVRLAAFLKDLPLSELERLIRLLNRSKRPKDRAARMGIYLKHKAFKPRILTKLNDLEAKYRDENIFTTSDTLRPGVWRDEYTAWYLRERESHFAQQAERKDLSYYSQQALQLVRIVRRDYRAGKIGD